jgi:hypothetical protein
METRYSIKDQMTKDHLLDNQTSKEAIDNGYNMVSILVCLYGQRFLNSLCIDMIKLEI